MLRGQRGGLETAVASEHATHRDDRVFEDMLAEPPLRPSSRFEAFTVFEIFVEVTVEYCAEVAVKNDQIDFLVLRG